LIKWVWPKTMFVPSGKSSLTDFSSILHSLIVAGCSLLVAR
jgi:hypothetical protein